MKNSITLLLLLFGGVAFAQTDYSTIPVKTAEECKAAEPEILILANHIISSPLNDPESTRATRFFYDWTFNCSYTFQLDKRISELAGKGNGRLQVVFLACMAKFVLDNPDKSKDSDAMIFAAYNTLADYVAKPENGVKQTKDVQKLIQAKKDDKLKEYINAK
jgi:hypothetical protein